MTILLAIILVLLIVPDVVMGIVLWAADRKVRSEREWEDK